MADVLMSGEALRTYSARGSDMFFKAIAERDDGDLSIMERTLPPSGRRPPAHRHSNCSEAYYVLDGQVSVTIDGAEHTLGPRASALVPRGTGHTFGNASSAPTRLLVIHAPAMDGDVGCQDSPTGVNVVRPGTGIAQAGGHWLALESPGHHPDEEGDTGCPGYEHLHLLLNQFGDDR